MTLAPALNLKEAADLDTRSASQMDAVTDADLDYAGADSHGANAGRWPRSTSGGVALGFALAGCSSAATLEERAMLVAKADRALGTDPVGELQSPAAPRGDARDARIAAIAKVPRASTEEHWNLPPLGRVGPRWCNGCASPHCRRDHADLSDTRGGGMENLSTVSRARVEKNFGRSTAAGRGFGRRGARPRGHNQP
jgi:hypothetical protein